MKKAWLLGLVLACKSATTAIATECASDGDCDTTMLGEDCCDRCEPIPGTRASIAARSEACRGKAGGPPRCPALDCPQLPSRVRCVSGRCAMTQ